MVNFVLAIVRSVSKKLQLLIISSSLSRSSINLMSTVFFQLYLSIAMLLRKPLGLLVQQGNRLRLPFDGLVSALNPISIGYGHEFFFASTIDDAKWRSCLTSIYLHPHTSDADASAKACVCPPGTCSCANCACTKAEPAVKTKSCCAWSSLVTSHFLLVRFRITFSSSRFWLFNGCASWKKETKDELFCFRCSYHWLSSPNIQCSVPFFSLCTFPLEIDSLSSSAPRKRELSSSKLARVFALEDYTEGLGSIAFSSVW